MSKDIKALIESGHPLSEIMDTVVGDKDLSKLGGKGKNLAEAGDGSDFTQGTKVKMLKGKKEEGYISDIEVTYTIKLDSGKKIKAKFGQFYNNE